MRRLFPLLTLLLMVVAALPLSGCCSGQPTLTLRNPFQVDSEPTTLAGPRLMAVPQYATPTYSVAPGCSPMPGYAIQQSPAPYGYATNPCVPGTVVR